MDKNITLRENLLAEVERSGRKMAEISRAAGKGATAVRDIIEGRSIDPQLDTIRAIAEVLGTSIAKLYGRMVRVVGFVGENAEVTFVNKEDQLEVEATGSIEPDSTEAYIIKGEALSGYVENGDVIYTSKEKTGFIPNKPTAKYLVKLKNGKCVIRKMQESYEAGRFHLVAINSRQEPMIDQEIDWCNRIIGVTHR